MYETFKNDINLKYYIILKQGHIVTSSNRRTSDRFIKPAIPPTIVSPSGPPIAANTATNATSGSPMDITKT